MYTGDTRPRVTISEITLCPYSAKLLVGVAHTPYFIPVGVASIDSSMVTISVKILGITSCPSRQELNRWLRSLLAGWFTCH